MDPLTIKPINTFVEGQEIIGFYLLKELHVKQTRAATPKDYFDIVLGDKSGEISAKFWEVTITDKETFFPMDVVKVDGIVQLYQDKLQFRISRMRKARPEDNVKLTDFVRSAPVQPHDLLSTIKATAASIQDELIRMVVEYCVAKVETKLLHSPAAKSMHHNYFAGLAYHMCRMLELGEFICQQRPFLNSDLVKAGIILHDIAKPEEMISELGIVSDYTVSGKLLGHISMANNWILEAAYRNGMELGDEKVVVLQHLVLSHHNTGEWGSPVQPQLPEAVALHYIDQLDAKMQAVEDALATTPEGEAWTPNVRVIENKPVYRVKW
ncbi:3'-5' exoribonuclease YhaM family protein [Paenibacillus koleovorans]|uniref:3'-5' exoribonuclease YhaM family protein n=1 Tax=Paenibacillus koleovorans TaxID=121608 RepID=UPI000FD95978|nr:HD domain-containing protein [Paenibacillus koleovorans]